MSHHFTQVSIATRYEIKLSTIIRDFGLTACTWLSHNLRDVEAALNEMKQKAIKNYLVCFPTSSWHKGMTGFFAQFTSDIVQSRGNSAPYCATAQHCRDGSYSYS
jgi:hypothetical protein